MRRLLLPLAALALVAALVVGVTQARDGTPETTQPGLSSTEIDRSLAGAPAPLAALHERAGELEPATVKDFEEQLRELRGYPVVVNAWAAWCGPCKHEFPFFQRAATRMGKKVAFLGLNTSDNAEDARKFLRGNLVPYPHLEDGDARIVQEETASTGLPVTIFYDRHGKQAFVHQGGYASEQDLLADIRRYAL
jgi:thiol-disulfide isomerase/thioredoxin